MENTFSMESLNYFSLFPLVTRLLAVRNKRMSFFISALYIMAMAKLKLKSAKIKPINVKHFNDIINQNKYNSYFNGDIYSCALVSINTLIALSMRSTTFINISKPTTTTADRNTFKDESPREKGLLKIVMPSVRRGDCKSDQEKNQCYLQCICVSGVPEDFVLYVTDNKLFNISAMGSNDYDYIDLIDEVLIKDVNIDIKPEIAKSAVVASINSSGFSPKVYELLLNEYFQKPRLLRSGDTFEVETEKYIHDFKSCSLSLNNVYFKVKQLSGNSDHGMYYIVKDYTNLYLNPSVHGYAPQKRSVQTNSLYWRATISGCPDGLLRQYDSLQKMFLPFLKSSINLKPMFLLTGVKGSGRKITFEAVVASFGLQVIYANCFDFYGQNPSLLKGKLEQLYSKAMRTVPCAIYLENIELLGRAQNYSESERLVYIFIHQTNELWERKPLAYPIFIVGTTNEDAGEVVPGIARLFVDTVHFGVFKFEETYRTLMWLVKKFKINCPNSDLVKVAEKAKGYVFADVVLLVEHALRMGLQNAGDIFRDDVDLSFHDFKKALDVMDAAYSDSIGAARVPKVQWEDIGGLADLKEEIMFTLNLPLKHPEMFSSGLKRSGIMFYGPPGTGKTLMAKAIATECNYNFLSVKGPELMNMYVGESEKNIREVFERARDAAPCIIFFDELDSLAPCRGKSGDSGGVTDRVVSQLLAEMDGLDKNKDVFVLAATNRPDLVDSALLRPGRFDKMFYVGICSDINSKLSVLKALTRRFVLEPDVDLVKVSEELPNDVSGADLYSISSNAWFSAARKAVKAIENGEEVKLPLVVDSEDFNTAVEQFVPSLTVKDIEYYKRLKMS